MDIEVNTAAIKADSKRMVQEVKNLRESMSSMNDAVNDLSGMWAGNANAAFRTQFASDYDNMCDMCSIVDHIIECMNFAALQYGQCDDEIRSIVSALRI